MKSPNNIYLIRHIKTYRIFEVNTYESLFKSRFGISLEEVDDLLVDIKDDFTDIDYWVGSAEDSWIVEQPKEFLHRIENIFVIYLESNKPSWEAENLYDLEHFLLKGKLKQIKSYLKDYGLEVYASDFGESDTQYEIVVYKKGTPIIKTEEYRKRYLQDKRLIDLALMVKGSKMPNAYWERTFKSPAINP